MSGSVYAVVLLTVSLSLARVFNAGDTIQFEWFDASSEGAQKIVPTEIYQTKDDSGVMQPGYPNCAVNRAMNDSGASWANPYSWIRFDSIDFGENTQYTTVRCRAMGKLLTGGGFQYCNPVREIRIKIGLPIAPTSGVVEFDKCSTDMCMWAEQETELRKPISGLQTVYLRKEDGTRFSGTYDWFTFGGVEPAAGVAQIRSAGYRVAAYKLIPHTGNLTITSQHGAMHSAAIFALNGSRVASRQGRRKTFTFSTTGLNSGSYVVRIRDLFGEVIRRMSIH
ncbi:MAG: hypothetical protein GF398_03295 [Chitinivibrionales bacterium]|nr:hypothetical protein [Chitinivibrionales bacterium]